MTSENYSGNLEKIRNGTPEQALADFTCYADGRLDTIVEKDANGGTSVTTTVNSFSYAYDDAGRLNSKTENGTTTTYGYDYNGEVTTVNGTALYGYDLTGNSTASGVNVTTGNQLQTDGTYNYTYDAEGNEITKTVERQLFFPAGDN